MDIIAFFAWLIGLFVLIVAVLILAFTVFFHTTRWHLPGWLRALLVTIVIVSYAIWLLSNSDAFWPYRLGALSPDHASNVKNAMLAVA